MGDDHVDPTVMRSAEDPQAYASLPDPWGLAYTMGCALVLLLAFMTVMVLTGCAGPTPTPPPAPTSPPPVVRDAGASAPPAPTVRPTPRPLRVTTAPLSDDAPTRPGEPDWRGADVLAGPWSPDGSVLIAYRIVRQDPLHGPIGRVAVVDTRRALETDGAESGVGSDANDASPADDLVAPSPRWETGDVQGVIGRESPADWRADGTLILARADRPFVDADGAVVAEVAGGFGVQVRQVDVAPNGRSALIAARDRAWILDPDGLLRPVSGLGAGELGGWDWRFDGGALALSVAGDGVYVIDAATGQARPRIAAAPDPEDAPPGPPPAPRWLADGRLLLPVPIGSPGAGGLALGIADPAPDGTGGGALHTLLGLPPNPEMPLDASGWVSPDGRYIVYPQVDRGRNGAEIVAQWLWDVSAGASAGLAPFGEPNWGPDGRRFALIEDGGLRVVDAAEAMATTSDASYTPREILPAGSGVSRINWSRDGAWIVYAGSDGAAWLVASDGGAGPARIGEGTWDGDATWSPGGDRFALALRAPEGPARLTIARFEIGR